MTEISAETTARADFEKRKRGRRLFGFCFVGLVALLAYYALTSEFDDPIHLYQGLAMLTLAVFPSLMWARRGSSQLPVFEVLLLTTASSYAFPFLNGREQLAGFPEETITQAGFIVLFFQGVLICTHAMVRGRPGTGPFYTTEVLTQSLKKYIGYGLVLSTIYTYISVFYDGMIPQGINSVLRAAFTGIGLVTTFVQSRRWGQGELSQTERGVLVALLAAQVIMQFSTLFLVGGIAIIVLALVGYVAGGHRVPVVVTVVLFSLVALLHNGKSAMRIKYWEDPGYRQQVEVTALVPFYTEWIEHGLTVKSQEEKQSMAKKLLERTSLMHILCLVAYYTPEHQPFMEGKTYADIPGQFVPSFFWPGKPPAHVSTSRLSVYYGLQSEEATENTTIGFGMLTEAYANFGWVAVGVLGFVLGFFYKKVQVSTANSPILSYPGLFLIVLMAWTFQTEWPVSLWVSSFYQGCVGVMGIPFIMRNFLGD